MRTLRARLTAVVAVVVVSLGASSGLAAEAATARNAFGTQCSFDSPSGQVRMWWKENRARTVLSGDDGGVASHGQCSTVPASVSWMAGQLETVMRGYKAVGLPLTHSDKGIQRVFSEYTNNGSGAYDVFLDGASSFMTAAYAECSHVTYYQGRVRRFRTVGTMYVYDVPATVPDGEQAQTVRQVLAHELTHTAQCAVTNPRRGISAGDLSGPWIEAVPNAFSGASSVASGTSVCATRPPNSSHRPTATTPATASGRSGTHCSEPRQPRPTSARSGT